MTSFSKIKEVKNMRKPLLLTFFILLSVALVYGSADAAVTGPCSNCHTMHNSQGGVQVTPSALPTQSKLLNNNCLGCHTTDGTDPLANNKPRVKSSSGAFNNDNSLAGGYFGQTQDAADNHGSNQHDVGVGNTNLPAGYDASEALGDWYTGDTSVNGLTCAGTNGCHGDETQGVEDDMQAIKGGHHSPSAYRMLFVNGSAVQGSGAPDFEKALIASPSLDDDHNQYNATVGGPSISELCAKCHSDFHGEDADVGSGTTISPWKRHPTDVAIPTDWEIYTAFTTEWTNDPDAWKNHPLGFDGAESAGNARVICVSCHRAHGAEYDDNLRWDYATQVAGSGATTFGCLGCHDKQR